MTICITPLCEKGRILNGAPSRNAFSGKEITCAIDLGDDMYGAHGLKNGFSHELLGKFAKDNRCSIKMVISHSGENYMDSLRNGSVDILITSWSEDLMTDGLNARQTDRHTAWVVSDKEAAAARTVDLWMSHMKGSHLYDDLQARYYRTFNPHKLADKGITVRNVSPYDESIRKYAEQLGWDWRMLAALIYQESKYSINSVSRRGAMGLMQVMPQTGLHYGVEDLIDPERNLYAGTSHLKRLQRIFESYGMEKEELIKFTMAAYNAGEGRILDCIRFAESRETDITQWDSVAGIIPLMREDAILSEESVRLGKFHGHETITYVDNILSLYDAICRIHPSI